MVKIAINVNAVNLTMNELESMQQALRPFMMEGSQEVKSWNGRHSLSMIALCDREDDERLIGEVEDLLGNASMMTMTISKKEAANPHLRMSFTKAYMAKAVILALMKMHEYCIELVSEDDMRKDAPVAETSQVTVDGAPATERQIEGLNNPISAADFSPRMKKLLYEAGFSYLGQIVITANGTGIFKVPNFGLKSRLVIRDILRPYALGLDKKVEGWRVPEQA